MVPESLRRLFGRKEVTKLSPESPDADCLIPPVGASKKASNVTHTTSGGNQYTLNLSLRTREQSWDYEADEWKNVMRHPRIPDLAPFTKIIVYDRRDSRRPFRDHIWVEFLSKSLIHLIKPCFASIHGFAGVKPGIDARHIYNRRRTLRNLLNQSSHSATGALHTSDRSNLADLEILLNYVDEEFRLATEQLEAMNRDPNSHIEWSLLWALFTEGDLVETEHSLSSHGMAFKLASWVYDQPGMGEPEFRVRGTYLQWTGSRYVSRDIERTVERFGGMKKLNGLQVKPLEKSKERAFTERGKVYVKLSGQAQHLNYQTNIMWPEQDKVRGCMLAMKERAQGRVMIDVASFRRFNPNWDEWDSEDLVDNRCQKDSWICTLDENDPQLALLPPTLHGWSFTAKKWGDLLVEQLSAIPFQTDVFSNLVLPEDDKKLIKSLVEVQVGLKGTPLLQDIVPGKGGGLVFLLHGKPGTGKTLTAEAISEHLQLPLYAVSCSEFGTKLEHVESKLKHILQITSLWKAVVLIDEADIFLEARSNDISRNAIVGVFLRMLEYHSGIVVLTTNRVRTLDDAFRSRISLALKYRDLDHNARKMLWGQFLVRANASVEGHGCCKTPFHFSHQDVEALAEKDINGRVIKHVVRTAQALAISDNEPLSPSHVARVWKILEAFEEDLRHDDCAEQTDAASDT